MVRTINKSVIFFTLILMALALVSCSGGGSLGRSTGTLNLSLIDSPDDYQEVVITINEVQAHHEVDGWITLSSTDLGLPRPINLLDLVNGTIANLGATSLKTGHYTQMRLILDDSEGSNYIVTKDAATIPLKVPSGGNTGIKLVDGFDIEAVGSTELVLDFDVDKSIVRAGNSGKWLLKPTIKVVDTVTSSVSGSILDTEGNPVEGASVSAQIYNDTVDEADRVTSASGTQSDAMGDYFMYLPLLAPTDNPYNIVVTKENYFPACLQLDSNAPMAYSEDFVDFTAMDANTDTGTVFATISGLGVDESATVSIRQNYSGCGLIEIASFNLENTTNEELITLPTGDYQIVVSSAGHTTYSEDHPLVKDEQYLITVSF